MTNSLLNVRGGTQCSFDNFIDPLDMENTNCISTEKYFCSTFTHVEFEVNEDWHLSLFIELMQNIPFVCDNRYWPQNNNCYFPNILNTHYSGVIMSVMTSLITGVLIVYSTVCLGADQRKFQSSVLLAFVRGIQFSAQRASNAENVSIWWRHHGFPPYTFSIKALSSLGRQMSWYWHCILQNIIFVKTHTHMYIRVTDKTPCFMSFCTNTTPENSCPHLTNDWSQTYESKSNLIMVPESLRWTVWKFYCGGCYKMRAWFQFIYSVVFIDKSKPLVLIVAFVI